MKSYAQDREDLIIAEILKGVKEGFYVDVGANSPTVYSVTKAFYEMGWERHKHRTVTRYVRRVMC